MEYNHYLCAIDIDPTVLTSGTVYHTVINTGTKNISVNRVSLQTMSATGSGNTKCMLALSRCIGAVPSNGTVFNITKMDTSSQSLSATAKASNTGLTHSLTIDNYFFEVALRTGSDGHSLVYTFDTDEGIVLAPNQGLCIVADGDLISGASLHGCYELSMLK